MRHMVSLVAVLALVAAFAMPIGMAEAGSQNNPCNPCAAKANPCNPCAAKKKSW
jgi:hypothetical protein